MTTMSAREARRAEQAAELVQRKLAEIERLAARVREDRRVIEEIAQRLRTPSPTGGSPHRPLSSPRHLEEPPPKELTLKAWHDRLAEYDPKSGVFIRVSRIDEGLGPARGGGGHKLTFLMNLTDPQGPIEEAIERAAQAKGIWGPEIRFRLQLVSPRTKRFLTSYDLALAIAPASPRAPGRLK